MIQALLHNSLPVAFLSRLQRSSTIGWFFGFSLLMLTSFSLPAQMSVSALQSESSIASEPVTTLLTASQVRSRTHIVAVVNLAAYSIVMAGFNSMWYSKYGRSKFHVFNDDAEWLQVDKVGHLYGSYVVSRLGQEAWRWSGISRNKRIWYSGLGGVVFQTMVEISDGFSTQWGWSWSDFGANLLGSGIFVAQEFAWDDQRIKIKFSCHKNYYDEPGLNIRADKIYGESNSERFIKDYNAQTYWASVNLKSFLPRSNLPAWLSMAVGYGADGMFGANKNIGKDREGNIIF